MCMALWVYATCIWMPAEIRRLRPRLRSPKFGVAGLWVLGAKLGCCTMTGRCLNHWTISPASIHQLLWVKSDWLLGYMNCFYIFYKYEEDLIVRWKWPDYVKSIKNNPYFTGLSGWIYNRNTNELRCWHQNFEGFGYIFLNSSL